MADLKEGNGVHFYYDKDKKAHTKRYDGEWVDDTPRCGAYTEMPPDPLAPLSMLPDPLPPNELVDANGVLSQRLSEIRAERAQLRAKVPPHRRTAAPPHCPSHPSHAPERCNSGVARRRCLARGAVAPPLPSDARVHPTLWALCGGQRIALEERFTQEELEALQVAEPRGGAAARVFVTQSLSLSSHISSLSPGLCCCIPLAPPLTFHALPLLLLALPLPLPRSPSSPPTTSLASLSHTRSYGGIAPSLPIGSWLSTGSTSNRPARSRSSSCPPPSSTSGWHRPSTSWPLCSPN